MSSNQLTGKAGMYYCCYKLSVLGWNVTLTVRSAQGVDIIARRGSDTGSVGVQVRTLSNRAPVPLGPTLDSIMGDYWAIVNEVISASPRTFIHLRLERRLIVVGAMGMSPTGLNPKTTSLMSTERLGVGLAS
jgi:hypothetical protein